jgi:hypothetical protein
MEILRNLGLKTAGEGKEDSDIELSRIGRNLAGHLPLALMCLDMRTKLTSGVNWQAVITQQPSDNRRILNLRLARACPTAMAGERSIGSRYRV